MGIAFWELAALIGLLLLLAGLAVGLFADELVKWARNLANPRRRKPSHKPSGRKKRKPSGRSRPPGYVPGSGVSPEPPANP